MKIERSVVPRCLGGRLQLASKIVSENVTSVFPTETKAILSLTIDLGLSHICCV